MRERGCIPLIGERGASNKGKRRLRKEFRGMTKSGVEVL